MFCPGSLFSARHRLEGAYKGDLFQSVQERTHLEPLRRSNLEPIGECFCWVKGLLHGMEVLSLWTCIDVHQRWWSLEASPSRFKQDPKLQTKDPAALTGPLSFGYLQKPKSCVPQLVVLENQCFNWFRGRKTPNKRQNRLSSLRRLSASAIAPNTWPFHEQNGLPHVVPSATCQMMSAKRESQYPKTSSWICQKEPCFFSKKGP